MNENISACRTIIIDDHPLFRKGVQQLVGLDDSLELVGEASSGQEGIDMTRAINPELVLLDLNMKELDGMETLKILKSEMPDVRVVMLTVSDNPDDVVAIPGTERGREG